MSDKLNWLNRHFVLMRYCSLAECVAQEGYKYNPETQEMYSGVERTEEMVWKFADAGRWKCACELLSYMSHRRAAVWWVYNCVLSLCEELKIVPVRETDIDTIAKSFEPVVPDFAKVEPPKPDEAKLQQAIARLNELNTAIDELKKTVDPQIMSDVEEAIQYAFSLFKKQHGFTPMELLDMALAKEEKPQPVNPDSPIFKAAEQLETQLQSVRKETLDTIKAVIPPKIPEYEKKRSDNAMQAVYRWIVSPDEVNSKKALEAGNECPDTPAGLLSLCAFWAGGNLMPGGEQVVRTPAGLAANGLNQVLLMCALHKGGTRKLKERYEHYFNLGVEVMIGENNWEKSIIEKDAPHEKENIALSNRIEKNKDLDKMIIPEEESFGAFPVSYKRWKPEKKDEKD